MTRLRSWMVWILVFGSVAVGATDTEREAREIEDLLMAPCCFRQQVSVHQSPTANEVRRDIRARLAKGEPRQVILDAYVAEHGPGILVVPPAQGSNLVLYVLPPLALAGSVLLVVGVIRRFSTPADAAAPLETRPASSDQALNDRLTDDLRDLD
jgi:cytochrome c-type biogenesis protein CcmH